MSTIAVTQVAFTAEGSDAGFYLTVKRHTNEREVAASDLPSDVRAYLQYWLGDS